MANDDKLDLSDQKISEGLVPFGVQLANDQITRVREYVRLILKWNKLTSLTSITDPAQIVCRHFGESMFAASVLPMQDGRLVDIGSGAGFPGLALKLVCPNLRITLVESNKKKSAFLAEVARALELPDIEILPARFEEIRAEGDFANFVTARAVGGFTGILRWTRTALSRRGHILLWVGGEDITSITNSKGWTWNPPARVPDSQRRFILVGRYVGDGL